MWVPVDPLFEPPADPPLDSTSQKLFYRHFGVSDKPLSFGPLEEKASVRHVLERN